MKKGRDSGNKGENEQTLWDTVTRSVKPYKPSKPPEASAGQPLRKIKSARAEANPPSRVKIQEKPVAKGFDRCTETKLKRGQLPLEGRIDLHGLTQTEAFAALSAFIRTAVAQKKRTVLVITGKGRKFEGVLRQKLPQWLAEPEMARHVVDVKPAQPKDGGSGAFYLRLRKPK